MADTKVSGLAAASAFNPAVTQEFPINDAGTSRKISAAQMAAYFPNGTQGSSWYAQVTADQGSITAQVDLSGLTVTVTVGAGRRIKITGFAEFADSVGSATEAGQFYIYEGSTNLGFVFTPSFMTAGYGYQAIALAVIQPSAGAHTYKLSAARAAGTGTITMKASTSNPAFILVEDIGT